QTPRQSPPSAQQMFQEQMAWQNLPPVSCWFQVEFGLTGTTVQGARKVLPKEVKCASCQPQSQVRSKRIAWSISPPPPPRQPEGLLLQSFCPSPDRVQPLPGFFVHSA